MLRFEKYVGVYQKLSRRKGISGNNYSLGKARSVKDHGAFEEE